MFTPRHIKHSKLLLRHAQKYLRYKTDVIDASTREEIEAAMRRLQAALRQRDRKQIEARTEALDGQLHRLAPISLESHWRENCEVILVAIVVAVGIRSYFLQPFKIPTGSMQPTLNGIIGHKHFYEDEAKIPSDQRSFYEARDGGWCLKGYPGKDAGPNILQRIVEFVVRGRNYIDVVSGEDDQVTQVQPKKFGFFFTYSRILCQKQSFWVYAPSDQLTKDFNVYAGRTYRRGEIIARGAIDTGDQVFVDKFTYNFVKPHRGDVFVFRTNNIPGVDPSLQEAAFKSSDDREAGAPFYIKRLAGLPGDTLRIDPPNLFVNGKLADAFGFRRVMSAKPPYLGYALGGGSAQYLIKSDVTFTIAPHDYFALGDNSYNSFDSRYWGRVPEKNLVGRGLLVYWPFYPHWGLVR